MWFICKDAAPLSESGIFFRTLKQAQYFQQKGYEVKIICSDWVHGTNICHTTKGSWKKEIHDNVEYIFLKSLYYGNSSIKRFLSYIKFSYDLKKLLRDFDPPKVIVHTSRIPFDNHIRYFAKQCKSKYILDVSDPWPLEFELHGLISKRNPILSLFYKLEKRIYTQADHVVFSFEGGPNYIKDKKWDMQNNGGPIDLQRMHYVNTGIDMSEFSNYLENFDIQDSDLADSTTFKIIYLGSIRPLNNVDQLIDAAKCLLQYDKIQVLIYGDGAERERLEKRVKNEGVTNVRFKQKWITPEYVPYVLSKASLNLLNYTKGWAPYGGSMNKMFMAIASGKPILCNAGMGYSPIRKYNLGIDQYFPSSEEYAEAILTFYRMGNAEYNQLCQNCKKAAADFDCFKLAQDFEAYCNL